LKKIKIKNFWALVKLITQVPAGSEKSVPGSATGTWENHYW